MKEEEKVVQHRITQVVGLSQVGFLMQRDSEAKLEVRFFLIYLALRV
jgi:hypothetical protein